MEYPKLRELHKSLMLGEPGNEDDKAKYTIKAVQLLVGEDIAKFREGMEKCELEDAIKNILDAQSVVAVFTEELPTPVEEELEEQISDAVTQSVSSFGKTCMTRSQF